MSVPISIDLPHGYRRVAWQGRLGRVSAVVGEPEQPHGTALLIHGFTGSKEDYFAILGPLHERGWAVAAIDLPGMAESEGPAEEQHYDLPLLAGDVVAMREHWGGTDTEVHLVGHSIGGIVAREAVMAEPSAFASLTLYSSGPGRVGESSRGSASLLTTALQTMTPGEVQLVKERLDADAGQPVPPSPIVEFLRRRWAQSSPGHLLALAGVAQSAPDRSDALASALDQAQVPAMVLRGALDDVWEPVEFSALAERLGAVSVEIPGAGHSAAVEEPLAMADALDAFWHGRR